MSMQRACGLLIATLAFLMMLTACEHTEAPVVVALGQESPEMVMQTLIEAYRTRDIDLYTPLLHEDFVFRFQDGDAPPSLVDEVLTRHLDSYGTGKLFNSALVSDIFINLTYRDAEPAIELDMQGTMKIRVTPMLLMVDETSGTTWLVEGDVQDFYFVQGEGEDSDRWYILEWRDIPGGGGSPGEGVLPTAAKLASWGRLKVQY